MTRFVELPTSRDSSVWVNPDHIVSVEAHYTEGSCWVVTEMGCRTHIPLSQEAVVRCLEDPNTFAVMPRSDRGQVVMDAWQDGIVEVRDSVRENLNR